VGISWKNYRTDSYFCWKRGSNNRR